MVYHKMTSCSQGKSKGKRQRRTGSLPRRRAASDGEESSRTPAEQGMGMRGEAKVAIKDGRPERACPVRWIEKCTLHGFQNTKKNIQPDTVVWLQPLM